MVTDVADCGTIISGAPTNSLSSSNSTLSRKTTKRNREICDGELKELLANIFPHVRIQHILPRDRNSEIFDMALARNLFTFHPLSNFASQSCSKTKFAPWDPRTPPNIYTRPRLFLPYFEECKVNIIHNRHRIIGIANIRNELKLIAHAYPLSMYLIYFQYSRRT